MSSTRAFSLNKQLFNPSLYKRVRDIWFADLPTGAKAPNQATVFRWFGRGTEEEKSLFDGVCRSHFHDALASIGPQKYTLPPPKTNYSAEQSEALSIAAPFLSELEQKPDQDEAAASNNALSLVLLLDQIPRNIFREDQAAIYSHYDRIARALINVILSREPRLDLHPQFRAAPVYRNWFYMPLMHSEYLEDHEKYEKLIGELRSEIEEAGDQETLWFLDKSMEAEKSHLDILKRFGRYPHRNDHLGRETTREEREFMEAGGDSFGVKPKPKA
ncbi:hypothetical protein H2201_007428 [Coniosporium apollinis]|uniref:DUF924-domain-containing protein n=2 Tax=Coniosporium TaxID=2810619 RepID=A0ABQ9NIZ8_9PEZI|nr:hypothetical protein H2199_006819 [Cladosporium sp. JES 115]KAJ9659278.1 hypothetical protein H2201_007428 [Coniosporium apollinis]